MSKNTKLSVADYFKKQVELSEKSQVDLAREMGFESANLISNLKKGVTKIPLTRVGLIAKSLGIDPLYLLKMMLEEYMPLKEGEKGPTFWEVINDASGGRLVTRNEFEIIELLRQQTNNADPKIITDLARNKLIEFSEAVVIV